MQLHNVLKDQPWGYQDGLFLTYKMLKNKELSLLQGSTIKKIFFLWTDSFSSCGDKKMWESSDTKFQIRPLSSIQVQMKTKIGNTETFLEVSNRAMLRTTDSFQSSGNYSSYPVSVGGAWWSRCWLMVRASNTYWLTLIPPIPVGHEMRKCSKKQNREPVIYNKRYKPKIFLWVLI